MRSVSSTPEGLTYVDGELWTLAAEGRALMRSRVWRWVDFARDSAARFGVPLPWVLGVIYAESGGDPSAESPVGASGLMQLHSREARTDAHGRVWSRDALRRAPDVNIELGTRYLARLSRMVGRDDLAAIASRYNAGQTRDGHPHPDGSSPWGLRGEPGYITRVVEAANTAAEYLGLLGERRSGDGIAALALVAALGALVYWGTS